MKKIAMTLSMALVCVFACFCLTACGEPSPYVGTWTATKASAMGVEVDASEIYEEGFSFTLEANGSASVNLNGDVSGGGKWVTSENGFTLSDADGSNPMEFTVSGNEATIEMMGTEIIFTKG